MNLNEECYVSFLDILGFKNIVSNKEIFEVREIFKEIADTREKILTENAGYLDEMDIAVENTYIRIMSDRIVIAIPTRFDVSLAFMCECCRIIQCSLLKKGFF